MGKKSKKTGEERSDRFQRHPTMWNRRLINFSSLMSCVLSAQAAASQSPCSSQQELPYTAIHTRLSLPRTERKNTHTDLFMSFYSCEDTRWIHSLAPEPSQLKLHPWSFRTIFLSTSVFGSVSVFIPVHTNTPECISRVHPRTLCMCDPVNTGMAWIAACVLSMAAVVSLQNVEFNCKSAASRDNRLSNACNWLYMLLSTLVAEDMLWMS